MKIPTFNYCCCCIELRTGVLFFGWLGAVLSLLGFTGKIYDWLGFDENLKLMHTLMQNNTSGDKLVDEMRVLHKLFIAAWSLFYLILALSSIFLLLGVYREIKFLLKVALFGLLLTIKLRLAAVALKILSNIAEEKTTFILAFIIGNSIGVGELSLR